MNMAIPVSKPTMIGAVLTFLTIVQRVAAVEKACGMPADISLVLDSSASIYPPSFNKELMPFLKDLVSSFVISPDKVRFSLLTYGSVINKQYVFNFDEYKDEPSLLARLDTVKWQRGESTRTDLAVKYARKIFFPTARPNVKKIEIIVTDGEADQSAREALREEIKATKSSDVTIFAIGVGKAISLAALKAMATSEKYAFNVSSYSALKEIKDILAATACVQPTTPPNIQPCGDTNPDVVFTMDSSRMDIDDVRGVFDFMIGVIREEGLDYEGMRVGLLTGKCLNYRGFALGEFVDKASIGNYLDWLGQAEVKPLVKELTNEAFLVKNGGRKGARRVGVVVVPSKIRDPSGLLAEALRAKQKGIEIFAIGIGNGNRGILESIASSRSHIIQVSDGSALKSFTSKFVKLLCEKPLTTESPKPTPEPTESPKPTPEPTKKPNC